MSEENKPPVSSSASSTVHTISNLSSACVQKRIQHSQLVVSSGLLVTACFYGNTVQTLRSDASVSLQIYAVWFNPSCNTWLNVPVLSYEAHMELVSRPWGEQTPKIHRQQPVKVWHQSWLLSPAPIPGEQWPCAWYGTQHCGRREKKESCFAFGCL